MNKHHYTSLNVHLMILDLILSISLLTGLSKNEIVLMVLSRLARECRGKKPRHFRQVKYQKQDPGNYQAISLKLPLDAYEYFKDIRHVLRGSAALLISMAIVEYYDLFIEGKMDEAVFLPHAFVGFFINGQQLWVQHWGEIPQKEARKRRLKYFYNCLPVLD